MKIVRTSTVPMSLNILLKGQLEFLNQYYDVIGIASSGEDLEEVHNREGISTIPVNMERGISPLKDLVSLIRLYRVIKKEQPDIIHSITPKAGLLSMLAGKMAGVPVRVHTFTGLIFPSKSGWMQKLLIKMDQLLCYAATNVYPEGNGVKNDLIHYKITSKTLKVLGNGNVNGINLEYFDSENISQENKLLLKKELKIESDDFVFVFVGRLVNDKGINELVQAFKELNSSVDRPKNIKLLLVGPVEDDLDPLSDDTLTEIQNNKNIITVGFQKDVRPYFAISDALVFPSYREGFPNVVMQAGAMGLPSIVTDINGSNEIIIENQNGIIIPSKNVGALRTAMMSFFDDPVNYSKLRKNSRKMIKERYDQEIVWNALIEEYNLLLKPTTEIS